MTVRFPKYVEIVNPALTVLYWIILVLAIFAVCANLILERGWVNKVNVGQYIQVNLWVDTPSNLPEQYDALRTTGRTCRYPELLDYWWDSAGNERYEGYQCVPLCPATETSLTCLTQYELFEVTSNPPSAFLYTEYQDRFAAPSGSIRPPPKNSIVMAPQLLSVSLMYNFEVPGPGWMSFVKEYTTYKGASGGLASGEFSKITSVFLNSNDEVYKISQPDAQMKLTVRELLMLAGHPDLLEEMQPLAGPNMKPGAGGIGPYFRISGAELELNVQCYWPYSTYITVSGADQIDKDSYVCAIRVALKPIGWVAGSHLEQMDDGILRHRRIHGIRIIASTGGIFEFGSYNNLYQNLVSIVVVLSLPKQLLLFITAYLLGHMSRLYKRVIIERFNLLEQVAGMTTRLMSSSVTFVQLEDVDPSADKQEEEGGISKKRMSERLQRVLRRQKSKLDQDEVDTFVSFCFKQVSAGLENLRGSDVGPLMRCLQPCRKKGKDVDEKNDDAFINIECFSDAYTSNEEISFASIIDLFDKQRRIGILESMFMPKVLWEELHHEDLHLPTRQPSLNHGHTLEELKAHSVNMVHVFKSIGRNTFEGSGSPGAQSNWSSPVPQGSPRATPMLEDQGLPVDYEFTTEGGSRRSSRLEVRAVNDEKLVRRLEDLESRVEAWEQREEEAQRDLIHIQSVLDQREGDVRDLTLRLGVTDKNVEGIREYARDMASLVRQASPRRPTESRSEEKLSAPSAKDSEEAARQASQVEVSMSTARDALEPFLGPLKKEQVELRQFCSGLSERIRELDRYVSSLAHEVGQMTAQLSAHSASTATPSPHTPGPILPGLRSAGQGYVGQVAVSIPSRSNQSFEDSRQSSRSRDVNFVVEPESEDAAYGGRSPVRRGNDPYLGSIGKVNARHTRRSSPHEGSGMRSRHHGEIDPGHVDVGFMGAESTFNSVNTRHTLTAGRVLGESIHV